MKGTRFSDEQIVAALRDADATSVAAAARKHRVSEQSIHRWRKKFAGMEVSDVRELRRLRDENARLKKLVAERGLEVEVMKEIQAKKW
jgi:putative transposase